MKYMIDGHNLIGSLRDINLQSLDDEQELIQKLKRFCLVSGKHRVDIYFDKAAPGNAGSLKVGPVTAYFVHSSGSADAAIESRLQKMGKSAHEWTVVSSDRRVQTAARSVHAIVISSEQFTKLIDKTLSGNKTRNDNQDDSRMTDAEVEEWSKIFRTGKR